MFGYVLLLPLRSLFFSKERQKGNIDVDGGWGRWVQTWKNRGRGNYNQDTLYKKLIYLNKRRKELIT